MNQEECKEIKQALELFLNESLERVLMSNPTDSGKISRSRIRPLLMKGRLVFQAEEQAGKQAFHRNLDKDEAADYVTGLLEGSFRQAEITSGLGKALILVSKKGQGDREGEAVSPVCQDTAGRGIRRSRPPIPQPEEALYPGRGNSGSLSGGFGCHDKRGQGGEQPL